MSNRLGGKQATSYLGSNAVQPPNWRFEKRAPTQYDTQNVVIGDLWIDTYAELAWILTSLAGDNTSKGSLATWTQLTIREVQSITGNTGGAIFPDVSHNITIEGDGTTIDVVGNPGTNTLTMSAVPGYFVASLEGNSGGQVFPDTSSNINLIGDGLTIDITGDPLTNTLTAMLINPVGFALTGNTGGRIDPDMAGNLNLVGDGIAIDVTGNPGTNTLTMSLIGTGVSASLTGDTGGAVSSAAGNINILGGSGVGVVGNQVTNTLIISSDSDTATSFTTDSGSAVPAAGVLTVAGGANINTSGSGSTVTVNLDSSLSGITNLSVDNLTVNTSETLSFLGEGVVQTDNSGVLFSSKGTDGQLLISSTAGVPAWANITAGSNISIVNGPNSVTISRNSTGSNGWVLIGTIGGSGGSFTSGITNAYRTYALVIDKIGFRGGVAVPNEIPILVQLSSDGGATYYGSSYVSGLTYRDERSVVAPANITATNGFIVNYLYNALSLYRFCSGVAYLYDLTNNNPIKTMRASGTSYNFSAAFTTINQSSGIYGGVLSGPINALRVTWGYTPVSYFDGSISLYGLSD